MGSIDSGSARRLLQGLLVCGRCGKRMTVRYHSRRGQLVPDYICQREGIEHGEAICQHIPGAAIDEAIGNIPVEAVTPVTNRLLADSLEADLE